MDNKVAGLIGAMGVLVAVDPSQAAMSPQNLDTAMRVESYADLLRPIPNAAALLKMSDATALPLAVEGDATLQEAQYYHHHHHHHHQARRYPPPYGGPYFHHHHHGYYRRFYHHHHHHHFRDYGY